MDLIKGYPRSVRDKFAGVVQLGRATDKGRALAAGTIGEYHYNCPMDQAVFGFLGIDPDAYLDAEKLSRMSGAALFAGSVVHPHNLSIPKSDQALRRWTWLTALRVGYFMVIVVCTSSRALAIVAAVSALSAPSFTPIQQAVLYGYRSGVVNVSVRWGWLLAPLGVGGAAAISG